MITEEQMTYEAMSQLPQSWKGPAYLCPEGHQMHVTRFEYCQFWHKDAHCKGGCGWIDLEKFKLDEEIKKRTEGRKERENEVEIKEEIS
jgi:hypothetical protein